MEVLLIKIRFGNSVFGVWKLMRYYCELLRTTRGVAHLSKVKYCSSFSIEVNPHANEVRIQPNFVTSFVSSCSCVVGMILWF